MADPRKRFPSVPDRELAKLRDIWLSAFHESGTPPGGNAELWLNCVVRHLKVRGDQHVPAELLHAEQKLIEEGLAKELFAALSNQVKPDFGRSHDQEARFFELLHATAEERLAAVREVKGG